MAQPLDNGNLTKNIAEIYYNLNDQAGYTTSPYELLKRAKEKGLKVDIKFIKQWLEQQTTHTRHKWPKRTFKRRKILTLRPDSLWGADLVEVYGYDNVNGGRKHILVCQDLFSKKLWLRSLKTKSQKEMDANFRSIIQENQGRSPLRLWTDRGNVIEMFCAMCKVVQCVRVQLMCNHNIPFYQFFRNFYRSSPSTTNLKFIVTAIIQI